MYMTMGNEDYSGNVVICSSSRYIFSIFYITILHLSSSGWNIPENPNAGLYEYTFATAMIYILAME